MSKELLKELDFVKRDLQSCQNERVQLKDALSSLQKKTADSTFSNNKIDVYLKERFIPTRLFYQKRRVWWAKNKPLITYDVRDFIYQDRSLSQDTLENIWNEQLQYVTDETQTGYVEYWQLSEETNLLKLGDCEDLAIYRINKAINSGIVDVGLGLGFYTANDGAERIGHAYPIFSKDGNLFVLEATTSQYALLALDETVKNAQYETYFVITKDYAWKIREGADFSSSGLSVSEVVSECDCGKKKCDCKKNGGCCSS